ncbi:hypothetical protein T12_3462 [Trichinella patagoniensis]|uniref:Uncharacterized protein n=1 Tax=Trichinella patagoniensis TaxID=990121 RepID=A0A0V0ZSC5_9BILA|nr:hypothetical protein T12_3462 [Trichinella patagoniensis]
MNFENCENLKKFVTPDVTISSCRSSLRGTSLVYNIAYRIQTKLRIPLSLENFNFRFTFFSRYACSTDQSTKQCISEQHKLTHLITLATTQTKAILNSSATHFPQNPSPFCDSLFSDRLPAIDRLFYTETFPFFATSASE